MVFLWNRPRPLRHSMSVTLTVLAPRPSHSSLLLKYSSRDVSMLAFSLRYVAMSSDSLTIIDPAILEAQIPSNSTSNVPGVAVRNNEKGSSLSVGAALGASEGIDSQVSSQKSNVKIPLSASQQKSRTSSLVHFSDLHRLADTRLQVQ